MRDTYSVLVTIVVPSRFGLDRPRASAPFGRPTTLFPRVPWRRLFGCSQLALPVERVDQPGHGLLLHRFAVTVTGQQSRHHAGVRSFRLQPAHLRDLGQLVQTEPGLVRVADAAESDGRLDLVAHQLGQIERPAGTVADEQRPMVLAKRCDGMRTGDSSTTKPTQ